jgi:DNA-binding response OmpR family regulator
MQGDRKKSIDAGASDYITKPINLEELLDCMEHWLAPAPAASGAGEPAWPAANTAPVTGN